MYRNHQLRSPNFPLFSHQDLFQKSLCIHYLSFIQIFLLWYPVSHTIVCHNFFCIIECFQDQNICFESFECPWPLLIELGNLLSERLPVKAIIHELLFCDPQFGSCSSKFHKSVSHYL